MSHMPDCGEGRHMIVAPERREFDDSHIACRAAWSVSIAMHRLEIDGHGGSVGRRHTGGAPFAIVAAAAIALAGCGPRRAATGSPDAASAPAPNEAGGPASRVPADPGRAPPAGADRAGDAPLAPAPPPPARPGGGGGPRSPPPPAGPRAPAGHHR